MFCPYCGAKLLEDANFCIKCGRPAPKIDNVVAASAQSTDCYNSSKACVESTCNNANETISGTQAEYKSEHQTASQAGMNAETSTSDGTLYTITINRASQWFAVNPKIKLLVDEKTEYKIDNGETITIKLPKGTHKTAFSCGIRNRILNLWVDKDITLNVSWDRIMGTLDVIQE